MDIESIALLVGTLSVITNVVSVAIVLYVKSTVQPLVTELKNHAKMLEHRRQGELSQWKVINEVKERLSHVEARTNGRQAG